MSGMEKLRQAMIEQEARQLDEMPEYGDGWEPSEEFTRKIHSLAHPGKVSLWQKMGKAGRKVAIFALIAAAVLGLSTQIEAAREPIRDFVVNVCGNYIVAWFNPLSPAEKAEKLEIIYVPSNLPDGYELTIESVGEYSDFLTYENEEGEQIQFSQSVPEGPLHVFFAGEEDFMEMTLGDKTVYYREAPLDHAVFWLEKGYVFYCAAPKNVPLEKLAEISWKK